MQLSGGTVGAQGGCHGLYVAQPWELQPSGLWTRVSRITDASVMAPTICATVGSPQHILVAGRLVQRSVSIDSVFLFIFVFVLVFVAQMYVWCMCGAVQWCGAVLWVRLGGGRGNGVG